MKDNLCTKGVKTTCASKMLENFIAPYDATVMEKINAEDMFVSLKSEKGGEIQHIKEALQKGAIGCITEKDVPEEFKNILKIF